MRSNLRSTAWALVALAAGLGACHCGAPASPPADSSLPDGGVDARADARVSDAALDASRPDGWVDGSPCDATFIELPPTGDSFISVVSNQGRWVAYDYREYVGAGADIYLYDLHTCTEHRITNEPTLMQAQPFVWDNQVTYSNQLEQDLYTLSRYDIATGTTTDIRDVTAPVISCLGAMSDYVAYASAHSNDLTTPYDFRLLKVSTLEFGLLQTTTDGASSGGDISETRFTWPSMVVNQYNGIWYVDFATGDPTMIDHSTHGVYPTTWGDWIVWEDWRSGIPDLWGERVGAGEQVRITDNGFYNGYPRLRRNLLCFRTNFWGGGQGWDIALMDMDTWAVRRITATPHPGYQCGHADGGWLVYRKQLTPDLNGWDKIYAVNLVAAGFLDAQGHVIPE